MFGTTQVGGAQDDGTDVSSTTGGVETLLHSFVCKPAGDCSLPTGDLLDLGRHFMALP